MTSVGSSPHWIGPTPTRLAIFLLLFVGSVGILVAGLQPILLGGLQDAHRLSISEVGTAGALELFTLGIGAAAASALLKPRHIRIVGAVAALVMVLANLATLKFSGEAIVAWRGVAGAAEGVMMWLPALLITRAALPERWEAIFLTVQTLAQLAVAAVVPMVAHHGAEGQTVVLIMAICAGAAIFAAIGGPNSFQALPAVQRTTPLGFNPKAILGLFCIFAYLAFIVGLWVYVLPIGLHAGLAPEVVGYATAVSLGAQIVGGVAAALFGRRIPYLWVLIGAGVVNLGLLAVFAGTPGPALFLIAIAAHGFLWLFVMPYQVLLLIDVDPTRRLAMYGGPTQILGSSAGPYIASLFVTDQNPSAALAVGAVCILLSLLSLAGLNLASRMGRRA